MRPFLANAMKIYIGNMHMFRYLILSVKYFYTFPIDKTNVISG